MRPWKLCCPALCLLLAGACGDDETNGSSTTAGTGGSGGASASSSSTSSSSSASSSSASSAATSSSSASTGGTGGGGQGGGGTGGLATGGSGGLATGGSGGLASGGAATGGSGGSGGGGPVEICGNASDDDGDTFVDCADADCAQAAACGNLVINEIDYDQASTDTNEFIEIYNAGAGSVDLATVTVVLVNGSDSMPYDQIALSGTLAAGQYAVLASATVNVAAGALVIPFAAADSNVQNGAPDAVALYDGVAHSVLDAISYEGGINNAMIDGGVYNLVAGNATAALDNSDPARSIIRFPNGQSTGDDAIDWLETTILTPGAANVLSENCANTVDDDGDGAIDCADTDCAADPGCVEICDNVVDDNGNGLADCAEASCDGQACDALGGVCAALTCTCPGGLVEALCGNGTDDDCDGDIDCADGDCAAAPACIVAGINAVDYTVIAQGGKLVITGSGFAGATAVTLGGVAQTFVVDSDTQITIASVLDATPIGSQNLTVTVPTGTTAPFALTVIRLQVSEIDSDTTGTDAAEFVEISTGVPNVSLAGYTLVFYNGSVDTSYSAIALAATTDANGLVLIGNSGVVPAPALTFAGNFLQNGQDAVAIHQAPAASFPNATPVTGTALIDALVYDTADADDPGLLPVLTVDGVQVDEGASPTSESQSIQRCGDGRRLGAKFSVGAPSPGAANTVAPCP